MTARVRIDPERCVGSGDCAFVAPEAFEVDDETGQARLLPGAAEADDALLERAAHACPTQAISLLPEA
jgi:ferredoxin